MEDAVPRAEAASREATIVDALEESRGASLKPCSAADRGEPQRPRWPLGVAGIRGPSKGLRKTIAQDT